MSWTLKQKSDFEGALGITVDADNPLDALWEVLTVKNDESKVAPCLMPGRNLDMQIFLGGPIPVRKRKLVPEVSPEWPKVLARLQNDYVKIRDNDTSGREMHRQVLSVWREKYGIEDTNKFIPTGEPRVSALPHETTITESFNTADSDTLGPDLSWTEFQGDIDIVTNKAVAPAQATGRFNEARADSALSTDNHYAQASISGDSQTAGTFPGVMVRKDSSATRTLYYGRIICWTSTGNTLGKIVSGTPTNLGSVSTSQHSANTDYLVRLEIDGDALSIKIDSSPVDSATDTSISGNLYAGIGGFIGNDRIGKWDNFEAGDLAAGAAQVGQLTTNTGYWGGVSV